MVPWFSFLKWSSSIRFLCWVRHYRLNSADLVILFYFFSSFHVYVCKWVRVHVCTRRCGALWLMSATLPQFLFHLERQSLSVKPWYSWICLKPHIFLLANLLQGSPVSTFRNSNYKLGTISTWHLCGFLRFRLGFSGLHSKWCNIELPHQPNA